MIPHNISRRTALKWGAYGLSASALGSVLAACGSSGSSEPVTDADIKGKALALTILGVAGWPPSQLSVELGNNDFAGYARQNLQYDVKFSGSDAPFGQLFQKAATSLATKSQEFNLIVSDSQWLGAFAAPKWILPLTKVIEENKGLQLDWYSNVVTDGYMKYPEGSNDIYGLPQEGDVQVLYVRKDMLDDPKERAAFKAKTGTELPQTFEDFEKLTWDQYTPVMEFFTRPAQGLYGISLQYSKEYDDFSCYYYPFLFSRGHKIWDPATKNVQGILNTDANAAALEEFVALKKFCPPGADQVGIPEMADLFTQGKVFSSIQWAAMGPSMIPDQLKGKVLVVPPPAFAEGRTYTLGGQPWVVNAFNDPNNMRAVIDFLVWWYRPETQLAYAKAGGNPCDRATLESPGFDDIQPWFRAYKYMLSDGKTVDFWHDPNYAKMLSDQQEALTAFSTGQVSDPKKALDYIAYKQQQTLYDAGQTSTAPSGELPVLG